MSKNRFVQKDDHWNYMLSENNQLMYDIPSLNFIVFELLSYYNSQGINQYKNMIIKTMRDIINNEHKNNQTHKRRK